MVHACLCRAGVSNKTSDAVIDMNVHDAKEMFSALTLCMSDVGFSPKERDSIFKLLSGILHIGNLEFAENSEGFADVATAKELEISAGLVGVAPADFKFALEATTTVTRGESLQFNYTVEKAVDNRDAIAKSLYGRLFGWLVSKANSLLAPSNSALYEEARGREGGVSEMGILDIFGFENFPNNSFEQMCINLANEQLQFYFNQHIFAWELASYQEEGVEVDRITYNDNQPLLDMFLQKPLGIFALLDEESRFPRATPVSYLDKVMKAKGRAGWPLLDSVEKRRTVASLRLKQQSVKKKAGSVDDDQGPFLKIEHFAGPVTYNLSSFLEKNRDMQSKTVAALLKRSDDKLVGDLFQRQMGRTGTISSHASRHGQRRGGGSSKLSTSAVFKNSLLDLMDKMLKAKPHFIRCIKPNLTKTPAQFSEEHVQKQLLYAGVIETTRIRRDGFSIRLPFEEFVTTYQCIGLACHEVPTLNDPENPPEVKDLRVACKRITKAAKLRGAQLGISMIFLKYYHGETLRQELERLNKNATIIATQVRGLLARKELQRRKDAKLRAIEAEKARIERERKAAERKKLEEEAALRAKEESEKAAVLAAAIAAEKRRASQEHMATLKKRSAANDAKLALQRAQEAAEAAKEEQQRLQKEAEEQDKEEERLALVAEEATREEERQVEQKRHDAKKREQEQLQAQKDAASLRRTSAFDDDQLDPDDQPMSDGEDGADFGELLESEDVDPEERRRLRELQAQRQVDEVKRIRELKKQHAEEEAKKRHERLAELERLAEPVNLKF